MNELSHEDALRARDRAKLSTARSSGRGRILRLALLFAGPGVLAMLGENDGPSMLSYAASGASYGIGFFLPFIVVTFIIAIFVQNLGLRVGVVTHRGFGELIFQRYGRFWGWVSAGDLLFTNVVTLIAELVAIRVGLAFFGIPGWVTVAGSALLVVVSSYAGSFDRWENIALGLAAFNLLFVAAALFSHPSGSSIGHAFATFSPLPGGGLVPVLLLLASDVGATVTPWMLFFQQSATADKGLTTTDLRGGRNDTRAGGVLAAITGCAALLAAVPLFDHHITAIGDGGAGYPSALRPFLGHAGSALFALGLVEAGALAVLTISASTAYAIGEVVPGGAHSFNDTVASSRLFHAANVALVVLAGIITLIPGAPLLSIALNANLLATVLMPAALVFLLLIVNDRELMGSARIGKATNVAAIAVTGLIFLAGGGYAIAAFTQSL